MQTYIERLCRLTQQAGQENRMTYVPLYPCLSLVYLTVHCERLPHCHEPLGNVTEIHYCRAGRIGWQLSDGNSVYLGPGDFTVQNMSACAESLMTFPNGFYEGLSLFVDMDEATAHPPEILSAASFDGNALMTRLCPNGKSGFYAGNETTERIFADFFTAPPHLADAYRRLRVQELLLYLSDRPAGRQAARDGLSAYRAEQVECIREVHDSLLAHLDTHITIEELARQFLMNPTTLKAVFRAVYGDSIASHIRTHRMEKAADLLRHTDVDIADIARSVGYDSQSRFAEVFREAYRMLPTAYRRIEEEVPTEGEIDGETRSVSIERRIDREK